MIELNIGFKAEMTQNLHFGETMIEDLHWLIIMQC